MVILGGGCLSLWEKCMCQAALLNFSARLQYQTVPRVGNCILQHFADTVHFASCCYAHVQGDCSDMA